MTKHYYIIKTRKVFRQSLEMTNCTLIIQNLRDSNLKSASKSLALKMQRAHPFYSISHRAELLVGLGAKQPCGLDIEKYCRRHRAFRSFVLDTQEQKIVSDSIKAWSLKEACFKVCNDGYEPADFKIKTQKEDYLIVVSKNYQYRVETFLKNQYLIAVALLVA